MEENNLIFGIRSVMEALKAGKEIDKILIKKDRREYSLRSDSLVYKCGIQIIDK